LMSAKSEGMPLVKAETKYGFTSSLKSLPDIDVEKLYWAFNGNPTDLLLL
jgi:hypothetical protein